MNERLIYNILLFIVIIICPWWVYTPILLIGLVIFPLYIEGLIFSFIIDVSYGLFGKEILLGFPYALISSCLLIILIPLKEKIRSHA